MLFSSDYNYFLFINCHGIIECALVREFALWLAGKMLQVWAVLCNNLHKSCLIFFDSFSSKLYSYWSWNVGGNGLFWQTLIRKKLKHCFDNWFIFSWLEILISAIGILNIICTYNLHLGLCSSCSNLFLCSKARLTKTLPFLAEPFLKFSNLLPPQVIYCSVFRCFSYPEKKKSAMFNFMAEKILVVDQLNNNSLSCYFGQWFLHVV